MDDIISSPPTPNPRKRSAPETDSPEKKPLNIKGSQFVMPTPPDTDHSSNTSPDVSTDNDERDRAVSPTASSSALSSIEVGSGNAITSIATLAGHLPDSSTTSAPPPPKRRKLTPSEKLEKQRAKEAQEQEKAELKALKDEQKRIKDEERRVKDEEKAKLEEEKREQKRVKDEEKRRNAEEKEAKKREKELEEERKAQEKLNRERKQMRLGAFFQQKSTTPAQQSEDDEFQARARRRSLSLETYDHIADKIKGNASPMKGTPPPVSAKEPGPARPVDSDYHKTFLPFVLQSHTVMPATREYSEAAQDAFDHEVRDPSLKEQYDLGMITSYDGHAELHHYFTTDSNVLRGTGSDKTRDLVNVIHGTFEQPIDLTRGDGTSLMDRLRRIPVKHIQFEEDVRPSYCGTFTKINSPTTIRRMRYDPFTRARQDTNYDYDSEVEWEPPEEGDDEVLSDEEDEADSQVDANDIDDFLDDEDDAGKPKRKLITAELIPDSTGLCWESEDGHTCAVDSIELQERPVALQGMRMGILIPGSSGQTIDPFSSSYWLHATASVPTPGAAIAQLSNEASSGMLAPPRPPLQPRLSGNGTLQHTLVGAAQGHKGPITTAAALQAPKRGPKPAPKVLNKEDLEEFREAVVSSPLGKLDLQKGLKGRFPRLTNEVIKETLSSQFAQIGKGKADKRWVFVGES